MSDAMTQALDFFMRWPTQIDRSASETETRAAAVTSLAALLTETRTKALEEAAAIADRELSNGIDDYKSHTGKAIRRLAAEGGEI